MTFSICVRETYEDHAGTEQTRYGVAVTTRLPAVGTLCPFASENGAVATQSLVNVALGRKGIEYLDDGLAVEDALQALLNADEGSENRQLHGVDADGTFVFSGAECKDWFGHREADHYTVAGNLLTGEDVIEETAAGYEEAEWGEPLARRLITALASGHAVGGDKREELTVQSAALLVRSTEDRAVEPYYNDLRVDATESPLDDLHDTYELAKEGYEAAMEQYEEADEADDIDAAE